MTTTQTEPRPTGQSGSGNGHATAGFCLGIVGMLAGFMPFLGFLVTVPALLLSLAGRRRFRAGAAPTPGLSTAGLVLGSVGSALCVLMTVLVFTVPSQPTPVQPVAAPAPAPAPVLLGVPNVVGMGDAQARDVLLTAGFTNVVLGPSTGPVAGVPAGTVTTQLPGAAALASAGDPIVLGEAAAPPAPPVVPQAAAPTSAAPPASDTAVPDADVDRPRTPVAKQPAAPQPAASEGSTSGSSAYYANCSEARAAGAAPLYRGQPGYAPKLDRDDDGIACE